jgi:hypothetical protein
MIRCEWTETIDGGPQCENPSVKGRSYCSDHVWLIYEKGTALGRRLKDARKAELLRSIMSDLNEAAEESDVNDLDFR